MTRPLVFLDTECLGLEGWPIWEIAAIRREADGTETEYVWQIPGLTLDDADPDLPRTFRDDFVARYHYEEGGRLRRARVLEVWELFTDQPTLVGAVPSFDAQQLSEQLGIDGWHHRLRCVETLTAGHLRRDIGGLGACADALGIDHPHDHTALGDTRTARAIWDRIMTGDQA